MSRRRRSSMCLVEEHLLCAQAGAICDCSCHTAMPGSRTPARAPVDPEVRATAQRARQAREHAARQGHVRPWISKDDAPCCQARRDDLGRPPIGYCSPDCVRRPVAHR